MNRQAVIGAIGMLAVGLSAVCASAVELNLEADGIEIKTKDPIGAVRLTYPMVFEDGKDPRRPTTVTVVNHVASLKYANGVEAVLKAGDDGVLTLTCQGLLEGDMKISHSFGLDVNGHAGIVDWSISDSEPKPLPTEKTPDGFIFRGDALKMRLTAPGSEGFQITIPFGYQELQDQRVWNTQSYRWNSYSHLPRNGSYSYTIGSGDGSPVVLGKAKTVSTEDIYVPYPPAEESLWPGKGPIRTFGWQDGIRRNYFKNRAKDENAIVFVGDSLTENWRTLEQDFPKYKVANRGVGGDTSRGMLFRLTYDVITLKPQIVCLCAGANDLTAHGDPNDALSNIREMITKLNAFNPGMPIVVSTVPPSSNPQAPLKPGAREAVNAGIKKIGEEFANVIVYDLSAACLDARGKQDLALFTEDRLHLGPKGYEVWKAGMTALFDKLLAPTSPVPTAKLDLSKFQLVWHDEFDGDSLDKTKWDTPTHIRQDASRWDPGLVSVADGEVTIKVVKTADPKYRYDSACIRTSKGYSPDEYLFAYKYGYLEARLKLPRHVRSDYWTGFWLLAGDVVAGRNDDTRLGTEIDIIETFDTWKLGRMKHTLHWGGYGSRHNAGGFASEPHLELLDEQYHTYGLYWDEARYVFFIDGVAVAETDAVGLGKTKGSDGAPLTQSRGTCRGPAYIKLSVEAAPWCGPTSGWEKEMPEEDELVADYIRLYKGTLSEEDGGE